MSKLWGSLRFSSFMAFFNVSTVLFSSILSILSIVMEQGLQLLVCRIEPPPATLPLDEGVPLNNYESVASDEPCLLAL